jgi:hypothetical protein
MGGEVLPYDYFDIHGDKNQESAGFRVITGDQLKSISA